MRAFDTMLVPMVVALVSLAFSFADAHSVLLTPPAREGQAIFEDPTNAHGCSKPGPGPVTELKAGAQVKVSYWRNNHIGGFARWSLVKFGQEESVAAFDQGVFLYTCRESGDSCHPKDLPYSFWQAAYDNTPVNSVFCGETIAVPDYLEDGQYVLQFTLFGTGHSYNNPGLATPTYRSCSDVKITGGNPGKPKPACPAFVGGDRVTKGEKKPANTCAYFHSNAIPTSVYEQKDKSKLNDEYKLGVPQEVEQCQGSQQKARQP